MLMWPWAGEAVCYKFERLPTERLRISRLGAATSLGGIAHYGTDRTGRVESASDGHQYGVSGPGQPALGVRPQVGRIGSDSPPDRPGAVGGSAAEEIEAPLERSDGSDREPVQVSAGCLTSGARSNGCYVVFSCPVPSAGPGFCFWGLCRQRTTNRSVSPSPMCSTCTASRRGTCAPLLKNTSSRRSGWATAPCGSSTGGGSERSAKWSAPCWRRHPL